MSEMSSQAADLARCLARDAEAVCRHYLSQGHRRGRYWVVGDVANTPGRSLFVRLTGPDSGKGAAGKWTDAATCVCRKRRPFDLVKESRNVGHDGRAALLPFEAVGFAVQVDQPARG